MYKYQCEYCQSKFEKTYEGGCPSCGGPGLKPLMPEWGLMGVDYAQSASTVCAFMTSLEIGSEEHAQG